MKTAFVGSAMGRSEEISEITVPCSPNIMVGNMLEVGGRILMVTGIRHQISGSIVVTTTLEVIRPGWRWRARHRLKQRWHKVVDFFKTLWHRFRN